MVCLNYNENIDHLVYVMFSEVITIEKRRKKLLSRQKIVDGALTEFGKKSYAESSLNNICTANGISKGIIYHYFKDKDELYLICIQKCFNALMAYLSDLEFPKNGDTLKTLQCYFDARLSFFGSKPLLFKIFCDAIEIPPFHLKEAIAEIKKDFDVFNMMVLTKLLEQAKLRRNINIEDAVSNFCRFQDYFNFRYQKEFESSLKDKSLPKRHEENCQRFLDILLYGMIEK